MKDYEKWVMPAILLVGLGLRLIGLNVGLPNSPDPREMLIAQDVLNLMHFTAPPEIYNWPGTAWFYLIAVIGKLFAIGKSLLSEGIATGRSLLQEGIATGRSLLQEGTATGESLLQEGIATGRSLLQEDVILLARFVNVLLSTATLWFTYRLGACCYHRRVGQTAAGFLAVAMLHATNESRFALVDIPATFCVTLFLWVLMRGQTGDYERRPPGRSLAVWLGIIAGAGLAVKWTTAFVGLSALVFIGTTRLHVRQVLMLIGVSALTFTLLCPYWLIDLVSPTWNLFFEDFWYEATHYQRGHFGLFPSDGYGNPSLQTWGAAWIDRFAYLWTLLKWGMGWPLALLALFGIMHALATRRRVALALLAFVIPYLLFVGAHKVKFTRHLLILYPVLMVLAAAMLSQINLRSLSSPELRRARLIAHLVTPIVTLLKSTLTRKIVARFLIGAVALYSLVYTVAFASILLTQPTRDEVSAWIAANIPYEEDISCAPEILFNWLLPEFDRELTHDEEAEWALILMPNAEVFQKYLPTEETPGPDASDWYPLEEVALEETLAFYELVHNRYELQKIFRRNPRFLGIPISDKGAPFPMRALAHPEIRLYRRRE